MIAEYTRAAGPYDLDGVDTEFPFDFKVLSASHVTVERVAADGWRSDLAYNIDYEVTLNVNQDAEPGGIVTMLEDANEDGASILIGSSTTIEQPSVYTNTGNFYPSALNNDLDRGIVIDQELDERLSRAPLSPLNDPPNGSVPMVAGPGLWAWGTPDTVGDPGLRGDLIDIHGIELIGTATGPLIVIVDNSPRPFETFLPDGFNYLTYDAHTKFEEAWEWSIDSRRPFVMARDYLFASTPVLEGAGNVLFQNARIRARDDGDPGTVFGATAARAAMIVLGELARMSGNVTFVGDETVEGETPLAGAIFYKCHGAVIDARMRFENMSEGRFVSYSDNAIFGDVSGKRLYGVQPFSGADPAGSVEAIWGCQDSQFGRAQGEQIFKPVRYMSLGGDEDDNTTSNTRLIVGPTSGTGRTTDINDDPDISDQSSILSIRCGKDCHFGPVVGSNVSTIFLNIRYSGDEDYFNDGNEIVSVKGEAIDTDADVNAVCQISTTGPTTGIVKIGSIIGSAAGVDGYGLFANTGTIQVDTINVEAQTPMLLNPGAAFDFGLAQLSGQKTHAAQYDTVSGRVRKIAVLTGPTVANNTYHGMFNNDSAATSQIEVEELSYDQGGTTHNVAYVFADIYASMEQIKIGTIVGTGQTGRGYWAGWVPVKVVGGKAFATVAPSGGAYTAGFEAFHSAPVVGGIESWVNRTAGSPGTWQPRFLHGVTTVAALPAAGATYLGSRAQVTDANATTFAANVAAGGTDKVPVYCDGTNWRIG